MRDLLPLVTGLAGVSAGALAGWLWARRSFSAERERWRREWQQAARDARTDALTGLWNRRAFDEQLALQTAVARRYGIGCAIVLIDVDGLKTLNDRFGHVAVDAALTRLADLLRRESREADFAARFGGDEFALLLPATSVQGALSLAQRILTKLRAAGSAACPPDECASAGTLTLPRASFGVAAIGNGESAADLLRRADQALYRAKAGGGDRVCWHDGEEPVELPEER